MVRTFFEMDIRSMSADHRNLARPMPIVILVRDRSRCSYHDLAITPSQESL